jgi:hypothetical protein
MIPGESCESLSGGKRSERVDPRDWLVFVAERRLSLGRVA